MKIIQIITALKLGGGEIMMENLCYGLKALGHEVLVISLEGYSSPISKRLESANIKIYYLGKKEGIDFSIPNKLFKIFIKEQPDVLHLHIVRKIYVYNAAHKAKIKKLIYTVHNEAEKEQSFFSSIYSTILFRKKKMIPVGISPKIVGSICSKYKIADVPMVYNGIDFSKYVPKESYAIKDSPVILNVARFSPQKNHICLINAFSRVHKKIPSAKLQLIGDGILKEDIQKKVKELGITENVEFLGLKSNVQEYMHEADLFVLSSDYEGMPIAIIEAMACGMPIISTKVGGISDMIRNGISAMLTRCNEQELCNTMIKVLENQHLRSSIGTNALIEGKRFSNINMAKEYIGVYTH